MTTTETPEPLNLTFTVNALCVAETRLRKPLVAILEELQSEEGASLNTLRALVAAGRIAHTHPAYAAAGFDGAIGACYNQAKAGEIIDRHGIDFVAAAVGTSLRAFVGTISGQPR